jgi:anti-sigma regulatory factor (Ser/Thr protein kinase)
MLALKTVNPSTFTQISDLNNELPEIRRANNILHKLWIEHGLLNSAEGPITLCLEEVLSNIILHGCPPGRNYEIKAHFSIFEVAGGGIEVEVSDNAKAFDPLSLHSPISVNRWSAAAPTA